MVTSTHIANGAGADKLFAKTTAPMSVKEQVNVAVGGSVMSSIPKGKLPMETKLFINGEFVEATSGRFIETKDPSTDQVIAKVQEASDADVDKAVTAATTAFAKWQLVDGQVRRNLLNRLADLIEFHREQLAEIEARDGGKPLSSCLDVDMKMLVGVFRYYAGWADKIQGKTIPIHGFAANGNNQFLCYTRHEAIGVVGQIIPWNFPLAMLSWKLAPALAVGCACVLKTSEKTPLSALALARLFNEAGFPRGVVNIISGDGPHTGEALVRHPGTCKIAFTGSTPIGRRIASLCAECGLKRVSLELGGKSALVVFDDADLDAAADVAHTGLFFNMGQCCVASSRIFVHEAVHDAFVKKCVERARRAQLLPPLDMKCTHGPQVDRIQFDRVMGYIEAGKKEGAMCLTGGNKKDGPGFWVEPTVFANVTDKMKIAQEEIFGPVMCILKFSSIHEVIERANCSHYGLGAGVCTRDMGKAITMANNLKAGTVYVNCYNVIDPSAPFGGFRQSGLGRELGEYGLEPYYEVKTVVANLTYKE